MQSCFHSTAHVFQSNNNSWNATFLQSNGSTFLSQFPIKHVTQSRSPVEEAHEKQLADLNRLFKKISDDVAWGTQTHFQKVGSEILAKKTSASMFHLTKLRKIRRLISNTLHILHQKYPRIIQKFRKQQFPNNIK